MFKKNEIKSNPHVSLLQIYSNIPDLRNKNVHQTLTP